ncbi:MAG: SDH family Clp fold serine proteinase [Nitrososphaera sp.]
MGREERHAYIREIEKVRSSRVISYLTGDRRGLEAKIGMDIFPSFYSLLRNMGKQKQIDLFLYSTGGVTMAAWGLVNLIREFCDRFCVLIPYKAQSSATLISLGADEILMTRMGQLSPVDPTITSPYNPTLPVQIPGGPPQFLPVSVEDVGAYFDLAKEVGIQHEDRIAEVFRTLSSDVRPLALGSVYRAKQQIKMLSEKLLSFHMTDAEKIQAIVQKLIRELYSHDYLIGRTEAKNHIGLKITDLGEEQEGLLFRLFEEYAEALQLTTPYNPDILLGGDSTKVGIFDQAFVESTDATFIYRTRKEVKRIKVTEKGLTMEGTQEKVLQEGWLLEKPEKPKAA